MERPTLASQGIDKNLAHQARKLGALNDEEFESTVAERDEWYEPIGKLKRPIT
jgi:hypothetical protein